ncbi:hypothetical protein Aoki45_34170 [Algoriphagus sp. oki45]|uniref:transporter n=1 Tax=Algoriphagus sp. oki45 TaxID=3067294 RepID=UPI0027E722CD|nr:hypothetical protein Aoki45_34170 [Algoriphagus sp. oki45]
MKVRYLKTFLFLTFCLMGGTNALFAQGDGPRSYLLSPKGVTGINVKWLGMSGNLIPSGSVLVPGAKITADIFPITLFHTFSVKGRFAQVFFMVPPGSSTARATIGPPIGPIPVNELSASGTSDGFFAFKLGLLGAPALDVQTFVTSDMKFSLFGELRFWYSGTYTSEKLFNLGTNRGTFQLGLPMAIPLNKIRAKATWLEIAPSLQIFSANTDPARGSSTSRIEQKPMLILENHLSHNFNPKFWGLLNLRFQTGGQTSADGVKDENSVTALGGGVGFGYQLLPPLGFEVDYGGVLLSQNELKGNMLRMSLIFTYVNLKKGA